MIDLSNLSIVADELDTQTRAKLGEAVQEKIITKADRFEIGKQMHTGLTKIRRALAEFKKLADK